MVKAWTALSALALAAVLAGCGTASNGTTTSPGTNVLQATPPANSTTNAATTGSNSTGAGGSPTSSKWISYHASSKTADVTLKAGLNGGFDFNGYSKGKMTVTVPKGWTVDVTFTNEASVNHSAEIVPYSQLKSSSTFTPAFSGASTPNPTTGTSKGVTQNFTFTASKSGKYGIVCAVPGHDDLGMWDTFVVSSSASVPSVATT